MGAPGLAAIALVAVSIVSCSEADVYTLYRSGVGSEAEHLRIHVATFDTGNGERYNSENCGIARDLFQSQEGVTVRYWCEKGRFKP